MSHLLRHHQQTLHQYEEPKSFAIDLNIQPMTALMMVVGMVAIMGVISLTSLNAMSTNGYTIREQEAIHQQLVEDTELSDQLISEARAIQTIQNSEHVQQMVSPTQVTYMVDGVTGIATLEEI